MRKFLLFALMQMCCCGLFAQTTVETALELQIGDNSCDVTGTGYVSAYFKYTAPAESGQLITVTWASGSSFYFNMSEDGTSSTMISPLSSTSESSVFLVKAGQTVYLVAQGYNMGHVEFTVSAENAILEGGATCDDPVEIEEGVRTVIPNNYDSSNYKSVTYLSYACPEDGVLEMVFSGYVTVGVSEGCDGTATTVSTSYSGGSYIGKVQVEGGKNYILAVTWSYKSIIFGTFTLTHPTVGASCDMPFTGAETGNVLPAAAGTYWYSYTVPASGYVSLTSTPSLPGGSVSVYTSCGAYSADASVDGCMLLRFSVYSGNTYLICVEKNEATDSDETFDITYAAESAGDSFSNPIEIQLGATTVSDYNGRYYYKVTIPGEGAKFLKVTTDADAAFYSTLTGVSIMSENNQYSTLASGTTDVKAEVTAGESYVICWNLDEDINGFGFNVSVEDIAPGEVASNPIQAVLGNNTLTAGNDKYYTYTATKNGWLKITPDDINITTAISFPIVGSYVSYRTAVKDGFATKTEIQEGESYLIQFSGMSMDGTFTLEETDYAAGESKETAIVVEENTVAIPEKAQTYWYQYTAPQTGMLTISANIDYVMGASYQYPTVDVYRVGDIYPTTIMQTNSEGTTIYKGSFAAAENEVFYVKVVMVTAQSDKSLQFEIRDFEPGETSANPIELVEGENELLLASRTVPVWYSAYFNEGEVNISSTDYFLMSMYKADDLNTSVATSEYIYGTAPDYIGSYELNYTVTEAGLYLIKLEMTYSAGVVVNVSASIETGIDNIGAASCNVKAGANSIVVTPGESEAFVAIYNMAGQLIKAVTVGEDTEIPVEKGLYIVTVNGQAVKVIVHD